MHGKYDTFWHCFDCVCGIYILEFIAFLQHPCLKQGIPLEADLIKLTSYLMYVSDCWCITWPRWWPRELTALQRDKTHSKWQNTTKHFANQGRLVQNNMIFHLFYIWEMGELIFLLLLLFDSFRIVSQLKRCFVNGTVMLQHWVGQPSSWNSQQSQKLTRVFQPLF